MPSLSLPSRMLRNAYDGKRLHAASYDIERAGDFSVHLKKAAQANVAPQKAANSCIMSLRSSGISSFSVHTGLRVDWERSSNQPPMTTLAPSLPRTPLSLSFPLGLRSLPFFLLRKPSIPADFRSSCTKLWLWFAISLQLPVSLSTT